MESLVQRLSQSVTQAHSLEELTRPLLQMLEESTHLESTYLTTINEEQGQQRVLYARNMLRLEMLAEPHAGQLKFEIRGGERAGGARGGGVCADGHDRGRLARLPRPARNALLRCLRFRALALRQRLLLQLLSVPPQERRGL